MNSNTRTYWRIAGFYFFYYAFIGLFAPYWSLYLQSIHFNAVEIGILMSVQPVMRMLAPSLWGWLADHSGRRLQVVQIAAALSALFYFGVFFTVSFWGMFLVLGLMSFFWSASMPLVEATTLSYLGKHTARYGRIRSWGSVGFIVAVVGLGYAFDYIAIAWLLWAGLICELGIFLFSRLLPETRGTAHHTDRQPVSSILFQTRVLALFAACFVMAAAHGPYYIFFSIYLVEHGYAKSAVGGLWALGVICEIGVFFLMPWITRHFSFTQILIGSFGLAVLRFFLIAWYVDVLGLLLLAQMLHAATFGAYHAASVGLVHELFQGRHQAKGQALFGSLTYGAGGMVGGMASGPIWQHYGASVLYSCSALLALLGLTLIAWKLRLAKASLTGMEM
ncbi:MAG: MFS transporter [Gallionellales bacterium CG_4_8_14_3_um_filter_54_18]|nr:MAG: MFS transporter [Gallionellales bacterium CG_4_8_14_3_um_filter_54_18]